MKSRIGSWLFRHRYYAIPLVALLIPTFANQYIQYVVNLMLVYVLVTVGFNIALGYLGQLFFANAAFFGLGAYATGILMAHLGVPFWLALAPSGVVGALAGVLASLPALRGIRALYLAIITLAFGELMRWIYIHAEALTMGSNGLLVPPADVFGIALNTEARKFYVFLVITVVVIAATSNLLRSRVGRAIVAIKNNELVTASLGIPTAQYIILAFAWSGFVVGIAGGMFAVLVGRVVPESFGLAELIMQFAMVMIGGIGSVGGSIVGAIVLTAAPELFRGFPGFDELFVSLLLVLVLLFLPKGLISLVQRHLPTFRERLYAEPGSAS